MAPSQATLVGARITAATKASTKIAHRYASRTLPLNGRALDGLVLRQND